MKRAALVIAWFVTSCSGSRAPEPVATVVPKAAPVVTPIDVPWQPASFTVHVSGTGRPVILIPGLGCPASVWDTTVAHLGAGYQAHVVQIAGFAGAHPNGDAPVSLTVRNELAHYIVSHHLDHPIVIGHSMGGFLAMWLAADSAELVGPVIVLDGAAFLDGTDPDSARHMRDQIIASSAADFDKDVRAMFGNMFGDPKQAQPVIEQVLESDRKTFANALYELFTTDIRGELPKIIVPVLVLVADGPFADQIEKQANAIPRHESKLLPHTHHFVMFDDPKATFAAIDTFLAAHK